MAKRPDWSPTAVLEDCPTSALSLAALAASEESRIAFYFQSKGPSQAVWAVRENSALRGKGKL